MKDEHDNMKKYIFDMSLGWIIKVYLANLVAGVLAMCLFGNIVNAYIIIYTACLIWHQFLLQCMREWQVLITLSCILLQLLPCS